MASLLRRTKKHVNEDAPEPEPVYNDRNDDYDTIGSRNFMKTVEKKAFTASDMKEAQKRILQKLEILKKEPLDTPPEINTFDDFRKAKDSYLKKFKERLIERIEDCETKIEKHLLEKEMNQKIVVSKLRNGKEKFEVYGLIQR